MRLDGMSYPHPANATAIAGRGSGQLPCQSHPTRQFFPAGEFPWTDAMDPTVYAQPRQLCAGCSRRADCLAEALGRQEAFGVWGGTTPSERARIHLDAVLPPILRDPPASLLDTCRAGSRPACGRAPGRQEPTTAGMTIAAHRTDRRST